jgi:hypothetical protein
MVGHRASAPAAITARPSSRDQWLSLPNSSRHDYRRRVRRGILCVEDFDQPHKKIGERLHQPVDLVDDEDVDPAGPGYRRAGLAAQAAPYCRPENPPPAYAQRIARVGRMLSPPAPGSTSLRLATLHVLVEWDTHSESVREVAKEKVSHLNASALILRRS